MPASVPRAAALLLLWLASVPGCCSSAHELPRLAELPVVSSPAGAAAALRREGAFTWPPSPALEDEIVGADTLQHLDRWLLANTGRLAHAAVRKPHRREHLMLELRDAGGAVAAALGALTRTLGRGVLPSGSGNTY